MTAAPVAVPPLVPVTSLADAGAALACRPYVRRGVPFPDRPIRVLLADDQVIFRRALHCFLEHGHPDVDIVGEASGGREALEMAMRLKPDVVLMDLDMPLGDGESATRELSVQLPSTRVLVLTMHREEEKLLGVLRAGARGYLSKDAAEQDLVDAIRVVATGDVYVRPTVARRLAAQRDAAATDPRSRAIARAEVLSGRERDVLRLTAEGYNGPEIGDRLGITAKTVDTYKQRIEDKLGFAHRTDYVRFALECGVLHV